MLTVTIPALNRLSRKLIHKQADDDMALRVTRREGGWTLRLDHESAGDTTFTHDGRRVLLLDTAVSQAMSDMKLGTKRNGRRSRLRLCRNQAPKD